MLLSCPVHSKAFFAFNCSVMPYVCFMSSISLAFYDEVFDELKAHGIEPLVTISHYEMPFALTERCSGWAGREVVDLYVKFCRTIFQR